MGGGNLERQRRVEGERAFRSLPPFRGRPALAFKNARRSHTDDVGMGSESHFTLGLGGARTERGIRKASAGRMWKRKIKKSSLVAPLGESAARYCFSFAF